MLAILSSGLATLTAFARIVPPKDPADGVLNAELVAIVQRSAVGQPVIIQDPDAKLARKGKGEEAKLSYNGNLLAENRNGLIVNKP